MHHPRGMETCYYYAPFKKKSDKSNVDNYCPISLTSITCKVYKLLEHIIHSRIMDYLDANRILTDYQHGFRRRRSCESQLIETMHDLADSLGGSGQIDAVLLDFSKAFDKVDYVTRLSKMHAIGIKKSLLAWSTSFLQGRTQQVVVDGTISDLRPVLSGVHQGTV